MRLVMKKWIVLFVLIFPVLSFGIGEITARLRKSDREAPFLDCLSYIKLNPDSSVDVGPFYLGRYFNEYDGIKERHLTPGDSISMREDNSSEQLKYIGSRNGKVVFESIHTHDSEFGDGRTETKQKKIIKPYSFSEFSKGRESKILHDLLFFFNDYAPLYQDEIDQLLQKVDINQAQLYDRPFIFNYIRQDGMNYLLSKGADIHVKDQNGDNAVHFFVKDFSGYSAQYEYNKITFFIQKGIDPNEKNAEGMTFLDILAQKIITLTQKMETLKQEKETSEFLLKEFYDSIVAHQALYDSLKGYQNCQGIYHFDTKNCYTCESLETPKDIADDLCTLCPEREIRKGICHLTKQTQECHRRGDNWYMEYDPQTGTEKECKICEEDGAEITTTEKECHRCPGYHFLPQKGKCVQCPKGSILVGDYGNCKPCFFPTIRDTSKTECDKCADHIFFADTKECIKMDGKACQDNRDCNYEGYYCHKDVELNVASGQWEPHNRCAKGYFCTSNKDCNHGSDTGDFYCQITEINDSENISGLCQSKGKLPNPIKIRNVLTYDLGQMNWWDADHLCKAHGKRLFSVEEFQCYHPKTNTLIKSGEGFSLCCAQGKKCTKTENLSPVLLELKKQYGATFWTWTSSIVQNTAYGPERLAIMPGSGNVNAISADLNTNNFHALCQ